jgi:hypothetical protein
VVERLIRKITTAIAYAVFSAKVVLTLYDMMGAYTKAHDLAHKLAPAPYILRRSITDLNVPLPMALAWRKDNTSPLLARFIADVQRFPDVQAPSKK